MEYPYTSVPNTLRKFLKGVPVKAVPNKITHNYLESIGMKSSSDRSIIRVLKFVELLDGSGIPADSYKEFRDKSKGPTILADLIRSSYNELYSTYEDAHNQSDEALTNFFRSKSELGDKVIKYQVATFKALCEFGDFEAIKPTEIQATSYIKKSDIVRPEIHMNLQIHLPESKDSSVYEAIFQALAKHLLKRG